MEPFEKFLQENHPGYGKCLVCCDKKENTGKSFDHYYLVEKYKMANGDMYIINGHTWYDYIFAFNPEKPWEVIFKSE